MEPYKIGDAGALVKIPDEYKTVRQQFDEAHREQSDILARLFSNALEELGKDTRVAREALETAQRKYQNFVDRCAQELLREIRDRRNNDEGMATVKLYVAMLTTISQGSYEGVTRCIEAAMTLRKSTIDEFKDMANTALDIKSKYIVQEQGRVDIIIKRNDAVLKANLAAEEFRQTQYRLNVQQKADILQRQYDAYLEAYKREIDVAKDIIAKSPAGKFKWDSIPPRMDKDSVIPGRVTFANDTTSPSSSQPAQPGAGSGGGGGLDLGDIVSAAPAVIAGAAEVCNVM